MIWKFLTAVAVVWLAWRFWNGLGPVRDGKPKPPPPPSMSPEEAEARNVLGVGHDADEGEIRAAHRRLIATAHPDRGGSEEETRRINAAREVLTRRREG